MPEHILTTPQLYLSSTDAGWEGLVAQAFHEPAELEGLTAAGTPDISLILFAGGAMHMARRPVNGSWNEQSLRHGDLMLNSGNDTTRYEVRWKGLSDEPSQTLHLHLSKELVARTTEEIIEHDPAHLPLIEQFCFQDPLLTQIGFALWRELEEGTPGGKLYAQTAAQMLIVHLLQNYTTIRKPIRQPLRGLNPRQMKRVVDFIQSHLDQDLSLEALAQQAGFSPYHFARLFRQTTGESPHSFVLHQRIERAQHLLKATSVPLVQIAIESGFANQSHLTRVFKQYHGLTPQVYRRDCQI